MPTAVIGRSEELAAVEGFLEQVELRPLGLVLSGEAGIGKTALWEAGIEDAQRVQARVLSCRCVEAEASLSFTGLSDLIAPVLAEVASSLAEPRQRALEVALLLREPDEKPVEARAVGLAFLDVVRTLAESSPVVIGVDDFQWLDVASALTLQMAFRRLTTERLGLLATAREPPGATVPFDLERSFPQGGLTKLSLAPLSLGALHHVLSERLGLELTRPELARVHAATRGNPFYALELGREVRRSGATLEPGNRLPAPDELETLLLKRLRVFPSQTREALLAAAALQRPTLELVAAAQSDPGPATRALEPAERDGVIELDGTRVRFVHPLYASICYEQSPLSLRRAIHTRLASAVQDPEERVRHRALAAEAPDADVAADLEAVALAESAQVRSEFAAAELMELAALFTSPSDHEAGRRRRYRAGWLYFHSGARDRAVRILERLLPELQDGERRSEVRYWLVWARMPAALPDIVQTFEEALADAEGDDRLAARILGAESSYLLHVDPRRARTQARAALAKAERTGDVRAVVRAIARTAHAETCTLEITPDLLERGVELEASLEPGQPFMFYDSPTAMLGVRLMFRDHPERARVILEQKARMASDAMRAYALVNMVMLDWLGERWESGLEHAREAIDLADQVEEEVVQSWARHAASLVEAHLGQVEQARAHAEESLRATRAISDEVTTIQNLGVLGHIELALGNLEAAGAYLRELPGRLVSLGWNEPSSPVWPDTIETLIALGELPQARTYLEEYKDRARRASKRTVASATRCEGLLAAAAGELDGALEAFDRALEELGKLPYSFERARILLSRGSVSRKARQKRSAREDLEQAHALFDELGARLWAEKAVDELRRISGRKPAGGELTETEQRVASLAARGLANKEIATTLFMSVHTVEWHLTHVYRKLGVHSRAELAHRLTKPETGPVKA